MRDSLGRAAANTLTMPSFGSPSDIATAAKRGAILGAAFAATLGLAMLIRGQAVFAAYETPFWHVAVIAIGAGLIAGVLSVSLALLQLTDGVR